MPRGTAQIEVSFNLDANGILNVAAVEKSTGKTNNITITNNRGRFSEEQIKKMVEEAKAMEEEDNKKKMAIDARNELENYVHNVKQTITDPKWDQAMSAEEKTKVQTLCADLLNYVETNPNEKQDAYESKRKTIEDAWNPIAVKMYNQQKEKTNEEAETKKPEQPHPTVEEVD